MEQRWKHAIQERIQENEYVAIPPDIRDVVESDHPVDGPSVVWNYDRASEYAVLSREPLRKPEYVTVGRFRVYGADDDGQPRIRPPSSLPSSIRSRFQPESRVIYLAYDEMVEGEAPSVYVLSTPQLLELLPAEAEAARNAISDGGPGPLREALLRTPGFLPKP